jgi:hypothetical protein
MLNFAAIRIKYAEQHVSVSVIARLNEQQLVTPNTFAPISDRSDHGRVHLQRALAVVHDNKVVAKPVHFCEVH